VWRWACRIANEGRLKTFFNRPPSMRSRSEQGAYAAGKKREKTELAILEAAISMRRLGLEPLSNISELARRAGVSRTSVYAHVKAGIFDDIHLLDPADDDAKSAKSESERTNGSDSYSAGFMLPRIRFADGIRVASNFFSGSGTGKISARRSPPDEDGRTAESYGTSGPPGRAERLHSPPRS